GLGSAALRDAYSTSGDMLSVGDFGVGSNTIVGGNTNGNMMANEACGFYAGTVNTPTATSYSGIKVRINENVGFSLAVRQNRAFIQSTESGASMGWREISTTAVSDERVKSSITETDGALSVENIEKLNPVTFIFNDDEDNHLRRGFIAQEVEQIDPQYIKKFNGRIDESGDAEELLTLDTNPLLMDALTVLHVLIKRDKKKDERIAALEIMVSSFSNRS
ncbi:tail fiber domain-containing protein, partial [Enterobacteriaceae bacterium H20N1]